MRMKAVGMMSGTSMDGVDVALIETDGDAAVVAGPTLFVPYGDAIRTVLREAIRAAAGIADRSDRRGALGRAEAAVTRAYIDAAGMFLARTGIVPDEIDVLGMHGQTVCHEPRRRLTVQLGDGEAVSRAVGLPVVYDLRAADVAAGGEGAPLVPVYHRALVLDRGLELPVAVINIGGVANVTFVGADDELIAFDTGPGNALIDDLVQARTGARMDEGGTLASRGTVDARVLAQLTDHRYFAAPVPKSLDRDAFDASPIDGLGLEDAAATLVAFTVSTIATAFELLPATPTIAIVSGGGARNPSIMAGLSQALLCRVVPGEALGWSAEFIEAQAFAYLAVRSLKGAPLTFPGTTGVASPQTGGVVSGRRTRRVA